MGTCGVSKKANGLVAQRKGVRTAGASRAFGGLVPCVTCWERAEQALQSLTCFPSY